MIRFLVALGLVVLMMTSVVNAAPPPQVPEPPQTTISVEQFRKLEKRVDAIERRLGMTSMQPEAPKRYVQICDGDTCRMVAVGDSTGSAGCAYGCYGNCPTGGCSSMGACGSAGCGAFGSSSNGYLRQVSPGVWGFTNSSGFSGWSPPAFSSSSGSDGGGGCASGNCGGSQSTGRRGFLGRWR